MAFSLFSKFHSLSSLSKISTLQILFFSTSSAADKYYSFLLQKGCNNIEKSLPKLGIKLDTSCVNEVLKRCSINQSLLGIRFFIWAGLQSNYRHSSYTYAKACNLFQIKQNPHAIVNVIECYRNEGCVVGVKTFKVVLNLCKEANLADEALLVLRKMEEFGCKADTVVYNMVIRLFCEKGDLDMGGKLMEEMRLVGLYPDIVTYSVMIKGFCDVGRVADACELIKGMRENGCPPNAVTYSALIDGVCRSGSLERAMQLLGEMEEEGGDCSPNVVTYTSVIQAFCEKGESIEALSILDRMIACGCAPNRVTVSVLIKGFCVENRVEEVYKVIDKLEDGGVSKGECYSSLVVSLLRIGNYKEAEDQFRRILNTGVKADGLACSLMIKRLCAEGRFLDGYHLYDACEKTGFFSSIDSDIYSLLLDGLCQGSHSTEVAKLARLILEQGIHLKGPCVDTIIEHLKNLEPVI